MSYCCQHLIQDEQNEGLRLGGHPLGALLARMRAEGVDILGLGRANLPLLTLLPSLGIKIRSVRDREVPKSEVLSLLSGRDIARSEEHTSELQSR